MAFSGTISQTVFDTRRVIEHAIRRCKIPAQQVTAEYVDIAKDQLWLMLSDWSNTGTPLWCIQKQIYGLYDGQGQLTLDIGTIDVLNSNLRTLQEATGSDSTSSTVYETYFSSETAVSTVGILWSATAVNFTIERSDDGISWTTVQSETPSAAAGEWTWHDLDSVVSAQYIRVQATSGTLGITQLYWGNTPSEMPLYRMNRDDWANLPNKSVKSERPTQFWFDRQVRQPIMHLWPVPNDSATTRQIVLWRSRHIMDVGSLTQEIEVPQRWYEAVVAGLAARMVMEIVEADMKLLPILSQQAAERLYAALQEERDNSPIYIMPNIGMYTA